MSEIRKQFEKKLAAMSNSELTARFNQEVGYYGWGMPRAVFLSVLRDEFIRRRIDFSEVCNDTGGFMLAKGNEVSMHGNRLLLTDNEALYQKYDHLLHLHIADGQSIITRNFMVRCVAIPGTELPVIYLLHGTQEHVVFAIQHKSLQTEIDLTGVPQGVLFHFDERANFVCESRIETDSPAPFTLQSPSRIFLLMPDKGIPAQLVRGVSIKPLNKN